jgi:hypothetical protein
MEQQVWKEAVELNQNASRNGEPNCRNYRSSREILEKILHEFFSQNNRSLKPH